MKRILTAPLTNEMLSDIAVGDIVYYTGIIVTGRDDVHDRVVKQGVPSPVDLDGIALYHSGPLIKETAHGNYMVVCGPTTSMRMEQEEAEFIEKTGVKLIVGKGAMGSKTADACRKHGVIHCVFPGGCAVKAAECVEEVEDVRWRELGMPECMWVMRVKEFGPLIVGIDAKGNNLFQDCKNHYNSMKEAFLTETQGKIKDMSAE